MPSEMEHKYTSTGIKLWRHRAQMEAYREGRGNTVVSTHISPEGACNLKCPYCSVTHRDTHSRIDLDTITNYLQELIVRGLKAVILTGGGEPTAYTDFNDLVDYIRAYDLKLGLITNGTLTGRVDSVSWQSFDWVRVSVNFFPGWEERITLPRDLLRDDCVVGCSTVFTDRHEELHDDWRRQYERVAKVADRIGAEYVRVLPNCLLPQDKLAERHEQLDLLFEQIGDSRFFHQNKNHRAPRAHKCHQAHFRPYLSEEPNPWDKKPGTVYPCDSVVLNAPASGAEGHAKFIDEYAICRPSEVGQFLDGDIPQRFDPREKCNGCVFTDTVEMLDRWKHTGHPGIFREDPLKHEEFV